MKKYVQSGFLGSLLILGLSQTAYANLFEVSLGTAAPPSTLGPWSTTPFGPDGSAIGDTVSSVMDPFGRALTFDQGLYHDNVPATWNTWSHGYTGDAYDTASLLDPTKLTITPANPTTAFSFYVEPVDYADYTFLVTLQDGSTHSSIGNGNSGATGFGVYTTGSDLITSITVSVTDPNGFAIGEFAIAKGSSAVPDGGNTAGFGVIGILSLFGWCRLLSRNARSNAAE